MIFTVGATQVLSDDNRTVNYQYDDYGDLVA